MTHAGITVEVAPRFPAGRRSPQSGTRRAWRRKYEPAPQSGNPFRHISHIRPRPPSSLLSARRAAAETGCRNRDVAARHLSKERLVLGKDLQSLLYGKMRKP